MQNRREAIRPRAPRPPGGLPLRLREALQDKLSILERQFSNATVRKFHEHGAINLPGGIRRNALNFTEYRRLRTNWSLTGAPMRFSSKLSSNQSPTATLRAVREHKCLRFASVMDSPFRRAEKIAACSVLDAKTCRRARSSNVRGKLHGMPSQHCHRGNHSAAVPVPNASLVSLIFDVI